MAIFINDLAQEIKDCKIGIDLSKLIDDEEVPNIPSSLLFVNILLYADDIVCLADNEGDMQELRFFVESKFKITSTGSQVFPWAAKKCTDSSHFGRH